MIHLGDNRFLAEHPEDLDEIVQAGRGKAKVYVDAETTGFDDNVEAFQPYLGHRACGWAVTYPGEPRSWYVAVRHRSTEWNFDEEVVVRWLKDVLRDKVWNNANVKFDAHFAAVEGIETWAGLQCVQNRAKIVYSDRLSYALKPLAFDWCGIPVDDEVKVKAFLSGVRSKDYGRVPADILGAYACVDVIRARALDEYCDAHIPEECRGIDEKETLLTPVLFDAERRGMKVNIQQCRVETLMSLRAMIQSADQVAEDTGVVLSDSNACVHELMAGHLGLPVLRWNKDKETGEITGPSYDKAAMALYRSHPLVVADERAKRIVRAIATYRTESRFKGLYSEKLVELADANGFVHSKYTQSVRTGGRLACSDPNGQQHSLRSKALIDPSSPERALIVADGSQMEFRVMAHYMGDADIIDAYVNDPDVDFHQWTANICGMSRTAGKTMNFAMAFGAGKAKVTQQLISNEDVMRDLLESHSDPEILLQMCQRRAAEIYATYHDRVPAKATSNAASDICSARGYIRNAYRRRRHLPADVSYKAFNSLIQGCAGDVVKEQMNRLNPRYNLWLRRMDVWIVANVHDELVWDVPAAYVHEIVAYLTDQLPIVTPEFKVPFVWDIGWSTQNWKRAKRHGDVRAKRARRLRHAA